MSLLNSPAMYYSDACYSHGDGYIDHDVELVVVISSPHIIAKMWCLTSRESLDVLTADSVSR